MPIDAHNGASGGKAYDAVAPSITTTTCNNMILTFYTNKTDATWSGPAGSTEVYDNPNCQQGLTSNMMAYSIQADAGSTGPKTATASRKDYWVAQQIAIRPLQGRAGSSSAKNSSPTNYITTADEMTERDEVTLSVYPNPVVDRVSINSLRRQKHHRYPTLIFLTRWVAPIR